jgi:hypothetical protein
MKSNQPPGETDNLRKVLRNWTVDSALPPRFQAQVWKRIARVTPEKQPSPAELFGGWLAAVFRRPAMAVAYVAVLLIIGLTTGYMQAHDRAARSESQGRALYVQSVDPYQMPR